MFKLSCEHSIRLNEIEISFINTDILVTAWHLCDWYSGILYICKVAQHCIEETMYQFGNFTVLCHHERKQPFSIIFLIKGK